MAFTNPVGYQALPINGGTMNGDLILNADPSTGLQAATKQYVDSMGSAFRVKGSVVAASTSDLSATYVNGASGVGATLTEIGSGALSLDGYSPSNGDLVLIKDQTTTYQNGVYTVTVSGSGIASYVLTRYTGYDQPSEIDPGDIWQVINGSTQAGEQWYETQPVTSIGTDPILFSLYTVTGGQTLIASLTASNSATLDFNNVFSSSYNLYMIYGYGLSGVTTTAYLQCLFGTGGTPTYQTSNYIAGSSFVSNAAGNGAVSLTTAIPITGGASGAVVDSSIYINSFEGKVYTPSSSAYYPAINGSSQCTYDASGTFLANANWGGYYKSATPITSIRFQMSSGNINIGTIKIFGLNGV